MEKEGDDQLLEINLISAQGLKTPAATLRRLQTYAIAWVDPSSKLRTRLDIVGGENPTWNEKFLFRVTADFLSSETSGVTIEIYAVGYIKDPLLGTVRFLLSSCNRGGGAATPAFTAVQIRRSSGRFQGVLNIAATDLNGGLGLASISGLQAISFRDLNGENRRRRTGGHRRKGSNRSDKSSSAADSCDLSCGDVSDGAESTASSSSTTSTALKELNNEVREELAGKEEVESPGGALLCGLFMHQRKLHFGPSDENIRAFTSSMWKRKD